MDYEKLKAYNQFQLHELQKDWEKENSIDESKIGLIKLKKDTPTSTWRKLEDFFISENLFISSTPEGIMVKDIDKSKELIKLRQI
jgi:hypothetical protein